MAAQVCVWGGRIRYPRCQGPTTWLEVPTEPDAIDRVLVEHGLAPPRAPLPLPPQLYPDAQLSLPL
ncbi:MAG: hypothetical protein AAGN82_14720 [Myxococcota bacterium]